jgi:hypothetical protein
VQNTASAVAAMRAAKARKECMGWMDRGEARSLPRHG